MKVGVACTYQFGKNLMAMTQARSRVFFDTLLEMLKRERPASTAVQQGNGTLDDPYEPQGIGEWYWLAQQDTAFTPTFISVGGRLLARWGAGAEDLQDYVTDITGYEPGTAEYCLGKDNYRDWVQTMKEQYDIFDHQSKIDTRMPAYSRKALRVAHLDDAAAAQATRLLLAGVGDCRDCPELASTLVSLFVAESYRSAGQAVFPITLMLLDLVQTHTSYGQGGEKTYTWKSMLMHHGENSKLDFDIPGRSAGKKQTLGKHPMAGVNTATMGRGLFRYDNDNASRDRVISIMSVWLAHYLAKKYPKVSPNNFEYFIISDKSGHPGMQVPSKQKDQKKADETLEKACRDALRLRCTTLDCLIGGTTVYYVDKDWNQV